MSNNNNAKAIKSGIWYTISNFLLKAIGFLTTPIFTRLLTQAEFGEYSNFASWLNILTIIVTLNMEASLISAKYDYKDRFDNYIYSVLSLSTASVMVWAVVLNVFAQQATSLLSMDRIYINCALVYLLLHPAVQLFQSRERYPYRYKMSVALRFGMSLGTALLSVILVLALNDRLTGRVLGHVLPTLVVGGMIYVFLMIKGKRIDVKCWKYAIRICLPYSPHRLSLTLLNSRDRVIVKQSCGATETALYSLAYSCGTIITLLISSMNGAFVPWLGDKLNEKDYGAIRGFSRIYISLFCVLALGIMLATPEVLLILGGKKYAEAVYIIPPIAMGCVCQFIYTMFVNVEQFSKKTVGMAIASASAALLNYILNSILIPRYGYVAAAYTTLASFLWLLIAHMFLVYRLKLSQVYEYRFVAGVVALMCGVTVAVNWLYTNTLLRWIVIFAYAAILLAILWKNKSKVQKLLAGLRKKA